METVGKVVCCHLFLILGILLFFVDVDLHADFTIGKPELLDAPINEGPQFTQMDGEYYPCLTADGLTLYFGSERPGGVGSGDIWISSRETSTRRTGH